MILVDTSVWVDILRDKTGKVVSRFRHLTQDQLIVLSRFNQLELLQGAKKGKDFDIISKVRDLKQQRFS